MYQRRRGIALALCVVLALCAFVSSAFIVHEAAHPHACTGEDCPICQFIVQIEQLRRSFGLLLVALLATGLALSAGRGRRVRATACAPVPCTPVGRRVRLND